MNFEILKTEPNVNYIEITGNKDCLSLIKTNFNAESHLKIGFDTLNLGTKLYGNSRKETKQIQRENCKKLLKFYKIVEKAVKILIRKKIKFDGKFYVDNPENRKNNNDFMLVSMLQLKFNVDPFKHLSKAFLLACDYIDKENELNAMCDFKNNQCSKHRAFGTNKNTGCCPTFCKFTKAEVCKQKNLGCKIFMCNYLEDKGFLFDVHSVAILRQHFSFIERFMVTGLICRSTKKAIHQLWGIRIFTLFTLLVFVGLIAVFV